MSKKKVSAAQLAANRANGKNSTGPRTADGKAKVAGNALKHGLLSESSTAHAKLHGPAAPEEHRHYETLLAAFTADLAPAGPLETQLVERLASLNLRLSRITRIESGIFAKGIDDALRYDPTFHNDDAATLQQYPTERLLAAAYNVSSRSLNLLSYYESRLARDYHRTLQQLRQVQEVRIQQCSFNAVEQAVVVADAEARVKPASSPDSAVLPRPISAAASAWSVGNPHEQNSANKPNSAPNPTTDGAYPPTLANPPIHCTGTAHGNA